MSNTENKSVSTKSSAVPGDKRKNRLAARSQFNPNAPKISVDKFFSDFTQRTRNNVEVEFDFGCLNRIDAAYLPKVYEYAKFNGGPRVDPDLLMYQMQLVIRCAVFRKLVLATPQSQLPLISKYSFVKHVELYAPPSLLSAIDNLGKFEFDDFVGRIKNNLNVLNQLAIEILRVAVKISGLQDLVDENFRTRLNESTFDNSFFFDASSAQLLRERARSYLDDLANDEFQVDLGNNVTFSASYPKLTVSGAYDDDSDVSALLVSSWFRKLHAQMPEINKATRAALSLLASERWFLLNNINQPISEIVAGLPNWVTMTPQQLLTGLNYKTFDSNTPYDYNTNYIRLLHNVFSYVQDIRTSALSHIIKFSSQSDNAFGSKSQLVVVDGFTQEDRIPYSNIVYKEHSSYVTGECLFKLKEKQLVVNSLLFGFIKKVNYKTVFEARLNGSVSNTRKMYLGSDFINRVL